MRAWSRILFSVLALTGATLEFAAPAIEGEVKKAAVNVPAIVMFLAFVAFTLGIT